MKFITKEERDKFILDHDFVIKTVIRDHPILRDKCNEDMFQTGWVALIKCVDKYEVIENGAKFITYAYDNIRGALFHYINDYRNKDFLYTRDGSYKVGDRVLSLEEENINSEIKNSLNERVWDRDNINIEKDYEFKELKNNFFKELLYPKKKLRIPARQMLELYFLKEMPMTEIARKMNVSRQRIYMCITFHIKRAVKALKEKRLI